MINIGLEGVFKEKSLDTEPEDFTTLGQGFRDLVLGCPKIIIETIDDNYTNIYYRVHLKSGTYKVNLDPPPRAKRTAKDLESISYEVNDWYFTFAVDLGEHSLH